MNNQENQSFQYSYSAKEQAELKRIREKYIAQTETNELDKMEQIKRLDDGVTKKASVAALCVGSISTLIMGLGMSFVMTELRELWSVPAEVSYLVGIGIGLLGMVGVILAYPLYQHLTVRERRRVAPRILQLSEELMNGDRDRIR